MQAGDLVLFKTSLGICFFGRVSLVTNEHIAVYSSSTELSEEYVKHEHVVALTPEMKRRLLDSRESQLLVRDPVTDFYCSINDEIIAKTCDFLQDHHEMDFKLLERCVVHPAAHIGDFVALKKLESVMRSFDPLPASLYQKIAEISRQRVSQFFDKIERSFMFPIGLNQSLEQLKNFDFSNFARACILQIRYV